MLLKQGLLYYLFLKKGKTIALLPGRFFPDQGCEFSNWRILILPCIKLDINFNYTEVNLYQVRKKMLT
jgi:hypothetical protein